MSNSKLVRASRDGDQFHYSWAARRCLPLLAPTSGVVAVTIEGASPSELSPGNQIEDGEELIDVAEYYGSENVTQASLIRYVQLKHSTLRTSEEWTPSGLEKTLTGFASRYRAFQASLPPDELAGKLELWFVTNRPVSPSILETVEDLVRDQTPRHPDVAAKLEQFTGFNGSMLSAFCKLLRFAGNQAGYWDQRHILYQEVSGYLPDFDVDAPTQLKDLVARKATSEFANNPTITKTDVLRALKTDESRLFPAPCRIEQLANAVPREQEAELIHEIVHTRSNPIVIHAEGGIGKSVFATRIKLGLPQGSYTVVYDCFGNGQYRSASGYRHRHRDALVQIANELAAEGLCHPLIPTPHAEPSAYVRAFLHRLAQAATSLRSARSDALLCIVIDAADNAQIAAEEIGERRSFVRDLIREQLPEGVRLVATCRTHRRPMLDAPLNARAVELLAFSRAETAAHLRQFFADAIEQDISEFHHLSSHNPRVQSLALSRRRPLPEMLRLLGPNPTTVEQAIGNLLDESIAKLRDAVGTVEKLQIDRICAGLAALRPVIPIAVLASMSGVEAGAIKSFAFDLGRPLLVTGDTIQFFDEPSETWFRETFKPTAAELPAFVESLKPLASGSTYVASALPQLMLEAGHFAELVALALSSEALPETSPLERRDVELQRLQFALKASLRTRHYKEAAKLALKAGGETAGDTRQRNLIQANTDLAAVFLDGERVQELVSRRTFGSGWVGSHHAYEAGLMSGRPELLGEARSRLRMATEWLRNWSRLPQDKRNREEMKDQDIAEMAMAFFNIRGAPACARSLRGWSPRAVSYRVGRIVARRLLDHGRYQDVDDLAVAAENDIYLILAITEEVRRVDRNPPRDVVERALRFLLSPRIKLEITDGWERRESLLWGATALVEASHKLGLSDSDTLAGILTRYLPAAPSRGLSTRFGEWRVPHMRAYCLRAALTGQTLQLIDLADPELRKELERDNKHHQSRDAQEFKEIVGVLLPWHSLRAANFVSPITKDRLADAIAATKSASATVERIYYREESLVSDEIASLWFDILVEASCASSAFIDAFDTWAATQKRSFYTPTLRRLARLAALDSATHSQALGYANKAFTLTRDERAEAESKSSGYIDVARSILTVSKSEAAAYFNAAVEVASKIGDENLDRWTAMLELADRAARKDKPIPQAAYRLSRCAELTYEYVVRDKYFDWEGTVRSIAGLCPSSSLAILSRWRDRGFGWPARLLPVAVEFLVARGSLDSRAALALVGFRAHWHKAQIFKAALDASQNVAEKQAISALLYRYMSLEGQTARTWREMKDALALHGMEQRGLDELIILGDRQEHSRKARNGGDESPRPSPSEDKPERDWNEVFAALDLSAANNIAEAHRRFRSGEPPYHQEHFFKEAFARVKAGQEGEFITAVSEISDFNLYNLRGMLEQVPEEWKSRLAVKSALAATLKTFCRRFCMAITKSRHYEVLPFKLACELSGIPESDVLDVVLAGIGDAPELVGADRLFTLVGLLVPKLSRDEALDALSFGFDLFDAVLEQKDGDGPWSEALLPPADTESALAGYVWSGLAAPRASVRWEAAHAVRTLCSLGRTQALVDLVALARRATGVPYADARLHFYDLHARQWLLIALARAAKESPGSVAPHADFFTGLALGGNPHVMIRMFAARAALALMDAGALQESPARSSRASMHLPSR